MFYRAIWNSRTTSLTLGFLAFFQGGPFEILEFPESCSFGPLAFSKVQGYLNLFESYEGDASQVLYRKKVRSYEPNSRCSVSALLFGWCNRSLGPRHRILGPSNRVFSMVRFGLKARLHELNTSTNIEHSTFGSYDWSFFLSWRGRDFWITLHMNLTKFSGSLKKAPTCIRKLISPGCQ